MANSKKYSLLMSEDESYLVEISDKKFHTKSGIIDLGKLGGKKIKTHLGKEFSVVDPNFKDFLERKAKRLSQIIMLKDAALILAYTGISPGSLAIDIGTGSGFLAMFLGNYIRPGKVVTYENDKRSLKVATENIKSSGLAEFIKIKNKDATKGIAEKNADLVTVDMQHPERVIRHAYRSLKVGGYLVVYSPTVEEVTAATKEIRRLNFSYIKTVENIVREWQTERTTRPKTMGLMHTGFMTFARKMS